MPRLATRTLTTAARRILMGAAFGVVPGLLLLLFLRAPHLGYDYRAVWDASRALWRGHDPYPAPAAIPDHPRALQVFVYPPPIAFAFLPLAALPFATAAVLVGLLDVAAAAAALRILGVADWRCYGVLVASLPLLGSVRLGALSPMLLLLAAVTWRWRASRPVAGSAVAAAVVAKLFLWPLLIWLTATRRTSTAVWAVVAGCAATAACWGLAGFAGLGDYTGLLDRVSRTQYEKSYSAPALLHALGASQAATRVLLGALAAALLLSCWATGRRGLDRSSLSFALLASLLLTPLLWLHYFVLLAVPLALRWPRLSWAWLALLGFYATPWEEAGGRAWTIGAALGLSLALVLAGLERPRAHPDASTAALEAG